MPYEIWRSLTVQQKLQILEKNNPEVFNQISKQLNLLAISQEDFYTGEPNRLKSFSINNCNHYLPHFTST